MRNPAPLRIQLLGGFRLWVEDRLIDPATWRLRKARALVKRLALAAGQRLHREQIIEALWPDLEPTAAANNLHQALHIARRALTIDSSDQRPFELSDDHIQLWPDGPLTVDVLEFEDAATVALNSQKADDCRTALSYWAGTLLPEDRYDEWLEPRREALARLVTRVRLCLAHGLEDQGDFRTAVDAVLPILEIDAAHETAHALLMRLYARDGDRQRALRQYQILREALDRDLAAEPSADSTTLYQAILAQRFPPPGMGAEPVNATRESRPTPAAHQSSLPAALSSFIGREREIDDLRDRLAAAGRPSLAADPRRSRLVTLIGAGGSGKTRLALRVANEVAEAFAEGAWFVDLAPLNDPALVVPTCLATLGLSVATGAAALTTLIDFLRPRRALLILDNCEHLVLAAAELAAALLQSCPDLTVLATSREALGVAGEVVYRVPSMSLPDCAHPSLSDLQEVDAVRLFVVRAQEAASEFTLTSENAAAVVAICTELDGIPLAIELAAARTTSLSVDQIAARLADRFRLLRGGSRTARPRHQTLKALIDWSHDLLSEPEKTLLRRLAVFVGGWTLESAQAICGDADVDERLAQLVRKSLVLFRPDPEPRYQFLEIVRQYALDRLAETDEGDALRHRHLSYFHAMAQQAEPWLRSAEGVFWLNRMETELDNVRAALSWSIEGDPVAGLEIASSLLMFWQIRSHQLEGINWLRRFLAVKAVQPNDPAPQGGKLRRAKGLNALASLLIFTGGMREPRVFLEESLRLLKDEGEAAHPILAYTFLRLGNIAEVAAESRTLKRQALALAHEAGDLFCMAECHKDLALLELYHLRYREAEQNLDEAEVGFSALGDRDGMAVVREVRGHCRMGVFQWDEALREYRASQELFRSVGNRGYVNQTALQAGWAHFWLGVPEAARAVWNGAFNQGLSTGDQFVILSSNLNRGLLDWVQGDRLSAMARLDAGLNVATQIGSVAERAFIHHLLGNVAVSAGQDQEAAAHYESEQTISREEAQTWGITMGACGQTRVALQREESANASACAQAVFTSLEDLAPFVRATRIFDAEAHLLAGHVGLAIGDLPRAHQSLCAALGFQSVIGQMQFGLEYHPLVANARLIASFALLIVAIAARDGASPTCELERAVRLFAASISIHDGRYAQSPHERAQCEHGLTYLRAALGIEHFEACWAEGLSLTLDAARAQCLEVREPRA